MEFEIITKEDVFVNNISILLNLSVSWYNNRGSGLFDRVDLYKVFEGSIDEVWSNLSFLQEIDDDKVGALDQAIFNFDRPLLVRANEPIILRFNGYINPKIFWYVFNRWIEHISANKYNWDIISVGAITGQWIRSQCVFVKEYIPY